MQRKRTNTVRLQPVFLANVILYACDETIARLPFISRNCTTAMRILKTNPTKCLIPKPTMLFFPNTNTITVDKLSHLDDFERLPDTVTSIVVQYLDYDELTRPNLRFADRVVEIQDVIFLDVCPDLTAFTRLEKLTVGHVPRGVTMPQHTLKRFTVICSDDDEDVVFARFPPECAEQIVFIFESPNSFRTAKAQKLPPNVNVFCCNVGEGVTPRDFFPWKTFCGDRVDISNDFGVEELRTFNNTLPVPFKQLTMQFHLHPAVCDVSFLTSLSRLSISSLRQSRLALPTSVVELQAVNTRALSLSGTEHLTRLALVMGEATVKSCPRLRALDWDGRCLSAQLLRSVNTKALRAMTVETETLQHGLSFPTGLTSLKLIVKNSFLDADCLAPLTNLKELIVDANKNGPPLDLSSLVSVTLLSKNETPVSHLPLCMCT